MQATTQASPADRCGPRDHRVGFYETDAFLADSVADFLEPAWRTGEAIVVVATPEHRSAITAALHSRGQRAESGAEGSLLGVDAARLLAGFMRGGMPDPAGFHRQMSALLERACAASGAVRVFGEMAPLLWCRGDAAAAIALEEMWNALGTTKPFSLFCAYPFSTFAGEETTTAFQEVCQQHSEVVPDESFSKLATDDERARAVAILQQEAIAGITKRVELRRRQHELDGVLRRLRALDHLQQELIAMVTCSWRGPDSGEHGRRSRDLHSLHKTAVRTVRQTLDLASCKLLSSHKRPKAAADMADMADMDGMDGMQAGDPDGVVEVPVAADDTAFGILWAQPVADRRLEPVELAFLEEVAQVLAAASVHHHAQTERR